MTLAPNEVVVAFPDDGRDDARFIEDCLSWREIEILANAPAEIPHAPLIQRLRDVARANGWSREVVAVLPVVLAD